MTEVKALFFSTLEIRIIITWVTVHEELGWCSSVICEKPGGREYELGGVVGSAILQSIYVGLFLAYNTNPSCQSIDI